MSREMATRAMNRDLTKWLSLLTWLSVFENKHILMMSICFFLPMGLIVYDDNYKFYGFVAIIILAIIIMLMFDCQQMTMYAKEWLLNNFGQEKGAVVNKVTYFRFITTITYTYIDASTKPVTVTSSVHYMRDVPDEGDNFIALVLPGTQGLSMPRPNYRFSWHKIVDNIFYLMIKPIFLLSANIALIILLVLILTYRDSL